MTFSLASALRQAWEDGRQSVGTEYVFEELARRVDPLRAGLGPDRRQIRTRLAALNAGWVSVDSAARQDFPGGESDLAKEVVRSMREAVWIARRRLRRSIGDAEPEWTPATEAAVFRALACADAAGVGHAGWRHLFPGILADSSNRAGELVTELGVDPVALREAEADSDQLAIASSPRASGASRLLGLGALTVPRAWPLRMGVTAVRLGTRFRGAPEPMLFVLELEAQRQAVRLGSTRVGAGHLLVALLSLDQERIEKNWRLTKRLETTSRAANLLRGHGLSTMSLADAVGSLPDSTGDGNREGFWRQFKHDPIIGNDVAATLDRATDIARERRRRPVGTSHVLLALLETSTTIVDLLKSFGVDRDELSARILQTFDAIHPTRLRL